MSPPRIRLSWGYHHDCPRPLGAGEEREARAGWGLQDQEKGREGNEAPASVPPTSAPPPTTAIPITIHCMGCMGRCRNKAAYMSPSRIRLSWGYRHDYPLPARAGWGLQDQEKGREGNEAPASVPPHQSHHISPTTHNGDTHHNPLHGMYGKMPKRSGIDVAPPDTAFVGISP